MPLVGQPVPPLDHVPHPEGAPPGISVDIDYYHAWKDRSTPLPGTRWWPTRPQIDPIGIVLHTNAAGVEASLSSSKAHGNRGIYNTKPHYNFNAPEPQKNVPSDRRAIANSTGASIEDQYGCPDSSFWLLAIETCDRGYKSSPPSPEGGYDLGPFMYDHDELIARVLAYEAMVHNFPLHIPTAFYTPGVYTHTAPWPYPHLTTARGKTCPTITKKNQILDPNSEIMARAREIYSVWTGSDPVDPLPPTSFNPEAGVYGLWPLNPSKPTLVMDTMGDAVRYLQGVLKNQAGQNIAVDGDFGPQTLNAVKNFQTFFGLPTQYDSVDGDDWPVIDALATDSSFPEEPVEPPAPEPAPEPEPEPEPAPEPEPEPAPEPEPEPEKEYVSVGTGRYYLEAGGSPWGVSMKVYGNPGMVDELQAVNPGTWQPGQLIKCPDIIGRTKQVEKGESPWSILQKFFPEDNPGAHLDDFYFWNGGEGRVLQPGEWVYCSINWENPNG